MSKKIRVGVFGGTFNPPHIAHVNAAESFFRELRLDKLLIIPDYLPPHKELSGNVTAEERLHMCSLAFSHIDGVEISDMEIKRGGRSYTVHTLEELSCEDVELYLLIGTDMLLTLDTWYMPERIFALASVCYVRRESDERLSDEILHKCEEYKTRFGAKIFPVKCEVIELSSTELRNQIKEKPNTLQMLPDAVGKYVSERKLYND